ncbi:LysE family translocator [Gordonia McavH-238-E]|uniref:LysE family translocator n=1 Tax=Gordonia sp. McavH-238-E TaxID=2917736 RepID=UPI001EF648A7|nr:LysE family translocator [Gordonia sp. McavH-238-E]MCG7631222.1 LysE family translocator [Gordonia sp. McavH-238-E]
MNTHLLWGFMLAATLAFVIPGPDWFIVMRHAANSRDAGLAAALGCLTGLLVHMRSAALGISALLVASAYAFAVVKILGAVYLVVLGLQALRDARRRWRNSSDAPAPTDAPPSTPSNLPRLWAQGFGANVLNPKAALFFVAVLPQFLTPDTTIAPQVMVLGLVVVGIGLLWYAVFVLAIARFRHLLARRRVRIGLDAGSGIALCGLGGTLAFSTRVPA